MTFPWQQFGRTLSCKWNSTHLSVQPYFGVPSLQFELPLYPRADNLCIPSRQKAKPSSQDAKETNEKEIAVSGREEKNNQPAPKNKLTSPNSKCNSYFFFFLPSNLHLGRDNTKFYFPLLTRHCR